MAEEFEEESSTQRARGSALSPLYARHPPGDLGLATHFLWVVVDEIITTPIDQTELKAGMEGLFLWVFTAPPRKGRFSTLTRQCANPGFCKG
uniref:Uncharacterized protein n=1 Tax=Candidatus Caldatribacterium saccharofermentans TaxID=1454753 RepID=A0A7V4TYU1_9BACT